MLLGDEQIFERGVCSRVCLWWTGVITTPANESTLWLDSYSGITMPGSVVQSSGWAVSTLLQVNQITQVEICLSSMIIKSNNSS